MALFCFNGDVLINFLILFAALGFLWIGADLITKSALKISKSLGLSEGFIGLTIVALGTSFPEITMAVTGAIQKLAGQGDPSSIVLGDIIGSSINQLTLVIAAAGLLRVMNFHKNKIFYDSIFAVGAITVFYVIAQDGLITRSEGLLCLLFYVLYLLFVGRRNFIEQLQDKAKRKFASKKIAWMDILRLLLGLAVIAKSSSIVLAKGIILSSEMGVSEATVGILVLGFGSSLPELIVSINAALRGALALSISNVMGSIVVNVFLALGASSLISPWNVERRLVQFDIPYLLFSVVIVVLFILTKNKLQRNESMLILFLYTIYISLKVMGF
jgi:cation:H+ antiporter